MRKALRVIKEDFFAEADLRSAAGSFGSRVNLHVLEIET